MPYRSVKAPGCGVGPATWWDRVRARWVVRAERIAAGSVDFAVGLHVFLLLSATVCFFGVIVMSVGALWVEGAERAAYLLMTGYVLSCLGCAVCENSARRGES